MWSFKCNELDAQTNILDKMYTQSHGDVFRFAGIIQSQRWFDLMMGLDVVITIY